MNSAQVTSLLEYSALSYGEYLPANDKTFFITDVKNDVQYYIICGETEILIVFRGTSSLKDILHDLNFCKKKVPYNNTDSKVRVHSGFLKAYKSHGTRDKIHTFITDKIKKIRITGHSYGGALSLICAIDLQYNFPYKDYEVVVFGCPRVGNKYFSKEYNNRVFKTFRVENGNDLVTKLPPAILGYRHVGIPIHFGNFRVLGVVRMHEHDLKNYYKNILTKLL